MPITASANLAAIANGLVPDASKVNGELAHIEARAHDATSATPATFQGPINYAADTGAANAYVVTLAPALTALVAGQEVTFKAVNANTGASTLNVNALGAKNILKYGATALAANDLIAGAIVVVRYDGTAWQLVSHHGVVPLANLAAGTLPSGIAVPLMRVGYTGSFTTASLGTNGFVTQAITHSLGTDNVMVLVMAGGNTVNREWAIDARRPDGINAWFGRNEYASAASTPATGIVNIRVTNTHTVAQTITVHYVILRVD